MSGKYSLQQTISKKSFLKDNNNDRKKNYLLGKLVKLKPFFTDINQ